MGRCWEGTPEGLVPMVKVRPPSLSGAMLKWLTSMSSSGAGACKEILSLSRSFSDCICNSLSFSSSFCRLQSQALSVAMLSTEVMAVLIEQDEDSGNEEV